MSELDRELNRIDAATRAAVLQVIEEARAAGKMVRRPYGERGEIFSYPHPDGGMSWGVNGGADGWNIARGIKP
jgi:hypothetical protein